jgi:hypothetical protein
MNEYTNTNMFSTVGLFDGTRGRIKKNDSEQY